MSGSAFYMAGEKVIAKAKAIAAHNMKVDIADIKFEEGIFSSAKTNQTTTIELIRPPPRILTSINVGQNRRAELRYPGRQTSKHSDAGSEIPTDKGAATIRPKQRICPRTRVRWVRQYQKVAA